MSKKAARKKEDTGERMPEREAMVAEAAYYKAAQRGFEPGHEMADWLEAERQVEALLLAEALLLVEKETKSIKAAERPKGKRQG